MTRGNGSPTSARRNGSQEAASPAAQPLRLGPGDTCPVLVTGEWDKAGDRWQYFESPRPCGAKLGDRYRELRCAKLNHTVRQCPICWTVLAWRVRSDAVYCSTRCRVAAHRHRPRQPAASRNASGDRRSRNA